MTFHDVRLPEEVERGADGGPQFRTTILELANGYEKRNIDWSATRGEWGIGYGVQTKADFNDVIDFFHAREGRAHSFRFKDWSDYQLTSQTIGTTDTTTDTYQIFKRYTSGGINFDKTLEKIVSASATVLVNAVSQTVVYDVAPAAGEVSIATLTGILTLGSTHAATTGHDIDITCEFDIAVRFATDSLNLNMLTFNAGSVPDLPVIEVRGE